MTELYKLKNTVAELVAEYIEYGDADEYGDFLSEIADGCVPVYNGELAELLAEDPGLAYLDDPGLAEGVDDIFRIIAISVYEKLEAHAYEVWENLKEEAE